MASLWGSKKDDDPEHSSARPHNGEHSAEHAEPRASEANERTRLLQRPPPSQGYLSPDDPAVSSSSKFRYSLHSGRYSTCSALDDSVLTILTGIPVQPLERTVLALLHRTIRHLNLPLVGPAVGLHIHQSTWNALPWLRLL